VREQVLCSFLFLLFPIPIRAERLNDTFYILPSVIA
jgi:hypothetical protein